MGVSFSRPDFDSDYESEGYSRERGYFFEILRNLASHSCHNLSCASLIKSQSCAKTDSFFSNLNHGSVIY